MPSTWGYQNERFQCRLEVCFQRDIWRPDKDKSKEGPAFLREGKSETPLYSVIGAERRARVRGFQRLRVDPGAWRRIGSIQDGRLVELTGNHFLISYFKYWFLSVVSTTQLTMVCGITRWPR